MYNLNKLQNIQLIMMDTSRNSKEITTANDEWIDIFGKQPL